MWNILYKSYKAKDSYKSVMLNINVGKSIKLKLHSYQVLERFLCFHVQWVIYAKINASQYKVVNLNFKTLPIDRYLSY